MWGRANDLDKRRRYASASVLDDADANALAGNGERNGEPVPAGVSDPVTVRGERFDVDDVLAGWRNAAAGLSTGWESAAAGLPAVARSAKAGQLTFRSSTSKTSVAFGGMTPPAPCAP